MIARSWTDPAIKLFQFGVVTAVGDPTGAVTCEETNFDMIVCDLGVNFEFAKSTAFCPADFAMFKAVSTSCFFLMIFDKSL